MQLLTAFLDHARALQDLSSDSWSSFGRRFLASISDIVGPQVMIPATQVADTAAVPTSFMNELNSVRDSLEELSLQASGVAEPFERLHT